MSNPYAKLPKWIDLGLIPLINLTVAFLVSGLVVLLAGESPLNAASLLLYGSLGYGEAIGYTLFYATSFIFTGLSVAIAIHCGLFNIGSEGQAYIGGLGVTLACLSLDAHMPWYIVMIVAIIGASLFGALWALIPAWLQAKRGSHIVITTMLFNFIAASVMGYVLINMLRPSGSMAPQSRTFFEGGQLPKLDWLMSIIGIDIGFSPLNISFLLALFACVLFWLVIWRTKLGYEIRTIGHSPSAAKYAGVKNARIVIITMLFSGALAGMMALNPIMGEQTRLQLDFVAGAGFVGIAVALMGRSHPIGIIFSALLFGILYQGGAEIAFEMPSISREMIVVIQGLVILFAGALENMFRPAISAIYYSLITTNKAA